MLEFVWSLNGINDDQHSTIIEFSVNMWGTERGKLTETNQWGQWGWNQSEKWDLPSRTTNKSTPAMSYGFQNNHIQPYNCEFSGSILDLVDRYPANQWLYQLGISISSGWANFCSNVEEPLCILLSQVLSSCFKASHKMPLSIWPSQVGLWHHKFRNGFAIDPRI